MNRRDFLKTSAAVGGSGLLISPSAAIAGAESVSPAPLVAVPSKTSAIATPLPDLAPAEWIWYPSGRCLANTFVLFRRELTLTAKPLRATGWIAADSRYRLELNGQRIQWGPAPADPRWPEADPVDLTANLQAGRNVIGATVLFYGHGDGTWPIGKPGFLFWLELEHADGRKEKIVSGTGWQAHLCRAWKPGQYKRWFLRALQEEFDARLYPQGWSEPAFQPDQHWLSAMPLGGSPNQPALMTKYVEYATGIRTGPPDCELRPRSISLLQETLVPATRLAESMRIKWLRPPEEYFECRPPKSFDVERAPAALAAGSGQWRLELSATTGAALTFDFTEQMVGFPRFTIEAPGGTVIELMSQEGHDLGGPALLNTHFDNWTRFICREGVNNFECFDYESLRWLQLHIRGSGTAVVSDVGVRRRLFLWPNTALMRTSEAPLQRLFDAAINTLHNCAQDILVDGMGRERQQYSGDCGHQLQAVRLAFGETRSPARFLTTFSQGQTADGYFLDCWPAYDRLARVAQRQLDLFHFGAILDHGIQFNFDCWHHYHQTGDLAPLREPYPRLLRFANYLRTLLNRDGDGLLPVANLGIPCVWMDYQAYGQGSGVAPPFSQRHKQCAFNLYAAAMFQHALAPICRAFGDSAKAETVAAFGRELQLAAVKRFWSPDRNLFVNNLPWLDEEKKVSLCDRSLATAVLFDQCPNGSREAAMRALADCPREMGLSYPANAGWRLWALAKGGRPDIILQDLRTRWANMVSVKLNNTLQEGWGAKPDSPGQWSHCAVAPIYIAYQGLAGIVPLTPGYRRVEIRPQLADLEELELVLPTVHGSVHFHARGKMGARSLKLQLPSVCDGEIVLPETEKVDLTRLPDSAHEGHARYRVPGGQLVALELLFT